MLLRFPTLCHRSSLPFATGSDWALPCYVVSGLRRRRLFVPPRGRLLGNSRRCGLCGERMPFRPCPPEPCPSEPCPLRPCRSEPRPNCELRCLGLKRDPEAAPGAAHFIRISALLLLSKQLDQTSVGATSPMPTLLIETSTGSEFADQGDYRVCPQKNGPTWKARISNENAIH